MAIEREEVLEVKEFESMQLCANNGLSLAFSVSAKKTFTVLSSNATARSRWSGLMDRAGGIAMTIN